MTGADVVVRHGWTYTELRRLAAMAARRTSVLGHDFAEKHAIAMLALVEYLWAHEERPEQWALVDYAQYAVGTHVRHDMAQHGKTDRNEPAHHHRMYWADYNEPGEPATDRLVESLALGQVFYALDERDQEILWTRAMFPMSKDAADALGMHRSQFAAEHRAARRRAYRLWFDFETAPALPLRDRRAMSTGEARRHMARRRITNGVNGGRAIV